MRAGDCLCDEESEAEASAAAAVMPSRSERLEDARQELAWDRAAVSHLDCDMLVISGQTQALVEIVAVGVEPRPPDHDRRMLDEQPILGGRRCAWHYTGL